MYCFPLLIYNIYDCLSYFHVFCLLLDPFARTLAGLAWVMIALFSSIGWDQRGMADQASTPHPADHTILPKGKYQAK